MTDMSEAVGSNTPRTDPRLQRFDRNNSIKQKVQFANDIGKAIYTKNYPYINKENSSCSNITYSDVSSHSYSSSCDSISSIGSNHEVHMLNMKSIDPQPSINDLNLLSPASIQMANKLKPRNGDSMLTNSVQHKASQIMYYDVVNGRDYTKGIGQIINILKDMDVDGISEVMRRNNNFASEGLSSSYKESNKPTETKNSITVFRNSSIGKEPSPDIVRISSLIALFLDY